MVCVFSPELTSSEVERRCHGVCLLSGVLHHLVGFPFQEKEGCETYFLLSVCFINVLYWISSNSSIITWAYRVFVWMHTLALLSFCGRFWHSNTRISLSLPPTSFPASCIRGEGGGGELSCLIVNPSKHYL